MNLRDRIRREALRCATATTLEQIDEILSELVADVIHADSEVAKLRGLTACAAAIASRAEPLDGRQAS